ncbi:mitochondrial CIV assembly protein Coa4 [Andalucia godoyi]|uniref:Mitochondrial CIV assembly protein Coa4 n=1 Tax=Andalucia godoyi TaxID=505711 RepID=A0A8K0AI52_ANDGO|nr:mitochondrial CIV assembly protein Coa4 [Andalucia godoyi]|eukprot:ANDGO_04781.mRNA.1 mitochondrial CIV assembly protein Coa4
MDSSKHDEIIDFDRLVNLQGCGRYYQAVQECMERSERDWRACQSEVRAFRNCYKHSEFVKARESQAQK